LYNQSIHLKSSRVPTSLFKGEYNKLSFFFYTLVQFRNHVKVYFMKTPTLWRRDKSYDTICQICSPTTGTSNNCDFLSGWNDKRQVIQNRFAILICKVDVSEFDGSVFFTDRQWDGIRSVLVEIDIKQKNKKQNLYTWIVECSDDCQIYYRCKLCIALES